MKFTETLSQMSNVPTWSEWRGDNTNKTQSQRQWWFVSCGLIFNSVFVFVFLYVFFICNLFVYLYICVVVSLCIFVFLYLCVCIGICSYIHLYSCLYLQCWCYLGEGRVETALVRSGSSPINCRICPSPSFSSSSQYSGKPSWLKTFCKLFAQLFGNFYFFQLFQKDEDKKIFNIVISGQFCTLAFFHSV